MKNIFSVLCIISFCAFSAEIFAQGTRKFVLETENNALTKTASSPETTMEEPRIELAKNQICNVYAIDYSPDGKHIVAGYNNNLVRIWDITTGKM